MPSASPIGADGGASGVDTDGVETIKPGVERERAWEAMEGGGRMTCRVAATFDGQIELLQSAKQG